MLPVFVEIYKQLFTVHIFFQAVKERKHLFSTYVDDFFNGDLKLIIA